MAGLGASYYGRNYFLEGSGRNIDYAITPGVTSTSKMYCSKLVWQCYDGAGLQFKQADMNIVAYTLSYNIPSIISPYDFVDDATVKHNGFSIVKSFNW
ncbi:hypothetical protein H7E67_10740 [Clostridium gasigenes]|uniref:hypothetical protein n=1 Tax=Clostridium gasigenes TaxID=94869 RepID=UPI00162606AC|nr:hypothetical protein [Clostridium gasigenes]MBB6623903.1 hypothetical protein [Clostridium gasigenes]